MLSPQRTKRSSRSCILQRDTVLGNKPHPQCALLREVTLAWVSPSPRLPIGPRRVWAASGSEGTAAWLVVSAARNQPQTCSPSRRRLIWPEEALCALALATHPSPSREGPTFGLSPQRHKTRFQELPSAKGNCARGTNLTPVRLGSRSQRLPSSLLALGSP